MPKERKPGFFTKIFKSTKSGCCSIEFEEIDEEAENPEGEPAEDARDK